MAFLLFLSIVVANAQNQQGYFGDYKGDSTDAVAMAAAAGEMAKVALTPECLEDPGASDFVCKNYVCMMNEAKAKNIFDDFFFNKVGCIDNKKSFNDRAGCEIECCEWDSYAAEDQQGGECEGYVSNGKSVKPMHIFILISFLI